MTISGIGKQSRIVSGTMLKAASTDPILKNVGRKAYFTFGRFNPPTKGHRENFLAIANMAVGYDFFIYCSPTHDKKGKNPLTLERKLFYMKKMFPFLDSSKILGSQDIRTPVNCLQDLMMRGYDHVCFVVGSDRVKSMDFVKTYNGKDYTFLSLEIKSSGQRDADGDTFKISGTNQRKAAFNDDFKTFRKGTPSTLSDNAVKSLMKEIKENLPSNFDRLK
tara:strand:- start:970 stop:1629 length:660 start_codon:yes stop_codon:yes gene_type:complete